VQERSKLAEVSKDVESKTRKLTSGSAFYNDMVALHSDNIWEHQQKWYVEKQHKEQMKQSTTKQAFLLKKIAVHDIRKRSRESWTIKDISQFLTYKRHKNNATIKPNKQNHLLMLQEWEVQSL
jgi:hypothetical protein